MARNARTATTAARKRPSPSPGPSGTSRRENPGALASYRAKRDFRRTGEPRGRRRRSRRAPIFVVQLHDARRRHYDVRIEDEGVLRSWAVPKGPSTDPAEKRMAVRTEDHPLEYATFEGTIPAGEYGAGPVAVWDTGTYRNLTEHGGAPVPVADGLERGHVAVWLEGQKLRGGYAFTRIRRADGGSDGVRDVWLLVKMRDEAADRKHSPVRDQPASVRTGRTIEEIARAG